MNEIVFQVTQEADGGYVAECLSEDIFTQGSTWDELRKNVREAVTGFFFSISQSRRRSGFILCVMKSWPGHETPARPERE
jgi:predicted RNase H-like HicB family nuclease